MEYKIVCINYFFHSILHTFDKIAWTPHLEREIYTVCFGTSLNYCIISLFFRSLSSRGKNYTFYLLFIY